MGQEVTHPVSGVDQVKVEIAVELGTCPMPIGQILRLGRGAVIEFNTAESEPLTITASGTPIARGTVMVEDGKLAMQIVEICGE